MFAARKMSDQETYLSNVCHIFLLKREMFFALVKIGKSTIHQTSNIRHVINMKANLQFQAPHPSLTDALQIYSYG